MWSLWSASQREGYLGQCGLLCFESCSVRHVVIVVSFSERGYSEGLQSSLLAKMLCEDVVIVVSLSKRGLSWAVCSFMLQKLLCEDVDIVVSLSERAILGSV